MRKNILIVSISFLCSIFIFSILLLAEDKDIPDLYEALSKESKKINDNLRQKLTKSKNKTLKVVNKLKIISELI